MRKENVKLVSEDRQRKSTVLYNNPYNKSTRNRQSTTGPQQVAQQHSLRIKSNANNKSKTSSI